MLSEKQVYVRPEASVWLAQSPESKECLVKHILFHVHLFKDKNLTTSLCQFSNSLQAPDIKNGHYGQGK
ncbi:hypothetical protein Y1Q_0003808 [Alligator mississippiensis]|uniref:Uncharacterized protein n=1 Tax=Alligator mississippiensis TaxID=8496 RepID=A0A151MNF9_ALLMI|nr:hypothetical protein Y1Q_0003808 [Alligator mississippiensis]